MPLYVYQCQQCEVVSEVVQRLNEAPLSTCPQEGCGGPLKKLIQKPAVIFNGPGFHVNDYAGKR
jgi:putative FmdB family regulatory protein